MMRRSGDTPSEGLSVQSQESARPPTQWRTLKSPRSQLRREDALCPAPLWIYALQSKPISVI